MLEGTLSQQQHDELEALLLNSPEVQAAYVDFIALNSELKRIHLDSKPVLPSMLDHIDDEELLKHLTLHEAHLETFEPVEPTSSNVKDSEPSEFSILRAARLPSWGAHPMRFTLVVAAITLLFWGRRLLHFCRNFWLWG